MTVDFLVMRFVVEHNQLAFSHIMYIAIILMGSTTGPLGGLLTGAIAGTLVGPLMPYNTTTGEPQFWLDWTVRMSIMIMSGTLSGYFYNQFQKTKMKVSDMALKNPDSGIYNLNFLRKTTLVNRELYTLASLIISNQ